jgi:hypothetical protein
MIAPPYAQIDPQLLASIVSFRRAAADHDSNGTADRVLPD